MRIVRRHPWSRATSFGSVLLLLALSLAGPLSAQSEVPPATAWADPAAIFLLPGDALQVQIWREPELSGEFIVDEIGNVSLPLLGVVPVRGVPFDELRDQLIESYRVEIRSPSITIRPLRRIYVLGEVNRPGLQALDPTLSLAGAVALAGGASPLGDLGRMTIVREGREIDAPVGPERDLASIGIRSGDQIYVGRRSWLERNTPFVTSTVLGVAGIIVAILR